MQSKALASGLKGEDSASSSSSKLESVSRNGEALCYEQRRRDCSLPKKAMVTPSQISKPPMEVAMEMSSGKMRWTATVDGDEQRE
ncbi:hypothetical protein Q3G72_009427 [Acer saccharum]|nr:hypothetical protein Q3G72_009427 [Acer saccharum]